MFFCLLFTFWVAACRVDRPILILVSLDGWRWDYLDRAKAPALTAMAARGIRSEGLIPSFPSKTFPNHYTIVTGLYPEHHGIVGNVMVDAGIGERFTMSAPTARDSRWWSGEPLWATVIRQGGRASSMFWPGSEVEIGGLRPTDWKAFDTSLPNRDRTNQVIEWLRRPDPERPSFITLYFSDVDSVGHREGPDGPAVLEAAARLDAEIGALVHGVESLGLSDRVHYVIVSDHGMSQLSADRVIVLDDYLDLTTVEMVDSSPLIGFLPRSGSVDAIERALKGKHPSMSVYRREDMPARWHYSSHPRIPPVLAIAADGWTIATRAQVDQWKSEARPFGGTHGFDPFLKSMHGLLIVAGPRFKADMTVPPIQNVHLYEMMSHALSVTPAKNDGDFAATRTWFR